jgi:hypothetical protein
MRRFYVLPAATGWAVCYTGQRGAVAVLEAGTEEAAQGQADSMNRHEHEAQRARVVMDELQRAGAVLGRPARSGVRYFEPDAFA